MIEYNIVTGQSEVYTYQGDERFVNYFSCLTLLKEKLYLGTAGNGMLVFDIGKTAFSICPEVENGYIKVSLLLMMRYGWEQMEAVLE